MEDDGCGIDAQGAYGVRSRIINAGDFGTGDLRTKKGEQSFQNTTGQLVRVVKWPQIKGDGKRLDRPHLQPNSRAEFICQALAKLT